MRIRNVAIALTTATALTTGIAAPSHAAVTRPVDDRSSIKPMFELSSPSHQQQHWNFATPEQLEEQWKAAIRMGLMAPTIARIYNIELDGLEWQEREAANKDKVAAQGSANNVLASSLRWDTARGMPLGTALDWWIGAGASAAIIAAIGGGAALASSNR